MNLKRRVEQIEKRFHSGLGAGLTGWSEHLDSDDPELQAGVDEKGQAFISPYWRVWFLEGSKAGQERDLESLRNDPKYKQPPREAPNLGEVYVEFINGGCIDTIFCKLAEEEAEGRRPTLISPTS